MAILLETLLDNLKIFPFLFITYIFLEYIEHKTATKTINIIRKAKAGEPIIGSLCGILPQCGFSAAAANFYAARVISLGTLIAIFLSTSDEMLPILISHAVSWQFICFILIYKVCYAILLGYIINFVWHKYHHRDPIDIEKLCENENCHCENSIIRPALHHSLRITVFIFMFTLVLNYLMSYINIRSLTTFLQIPLAGEFFSGIIGLIPNCSASVILTQLFLDDYINIGTLMCGSLVSGGVGILVLFRVNRHLKENLIIISLLYVCGIVGGLLSHLIL